MKARTWAGSAARLVLAIIICLLPGLIGTPFTDTGPDSWYQNLEKPAFDPPDWVFGPVWSTLYVLMGIALYLIWTRGDSSRRWYWVLTVFITQLLLNALWTPAFFGLESPVAGLLVIVPLLVLIAATIALAWRYSPVASILLVPYLGWVAFATALNFSIWQLN
jgi:translocator protein